MTNFTKKSLEITFHEKNIRSDLYRYLKKEDVLILLNRLPLEEYQQLRSVTFETCRGADAYGYVHHKRITGIVICDQSERLSVLTKSAKRGMYEEFGALKNMKWPTVAVRRYLLYHTFLHELRHTQITQSEKKFTREKIPLEKLANEYADFWRGELYQNHFNHSDPVHNLPSEGEKERLKLYWPKAMEFLQIGIRHNGKKQFQKALRAYELAVEQMKLYAGDRYAENRDIQKLRSVISNLKRNASYITLSSRTNLDLFKKAREILKSRFEAEETNHRGGEGASYHIIEFLVGKLTLDLELWQYSGVSLSPSLKMRKDLDKEDYELLNEIERVLFEELKQ